MTVDSTREEIDLLLRHAARWDNAEEVISLLARGADPNSVDLWGHTALELAVQSEHIEIVKVLLDGGADANVRTRAGFTLLDNAVWKGHVEIVKILLDKGADPNAKDLDDDSSPLHEPVERGNVEIVKALLDKKANTHQANQDGDSPLWLMKQPLAEAIRDSHPDVFTEWWIEHSREENTAY